jgi:hypothetical protein
MAKSQGTEELNKQSKIINHIKKNFKEYANEVKALASDPWVWGSSAALMLKKNLEIAAEVTEDLVIVSGFGVQNFVSIAGSIRDGYFASWKLGSSVKDIASVSKEIVQQFGSIKEISGGLVSQSIELVKFYGMSADEAVKLQKQFKIMSIGSGETSKSLQESIKRMSNLSGVIPGDIFKDIASNSEFIAKYTNNGGKDMVKLAVSARQLGVEMGDVVSMAESLLDFEGSIRAEMEASALLGKQINLQKARELMLTGDTNSALRAMMDQMGGLDEWNKMNVYQREAMAKAMGTSSDKLAQMISNQKNLGKETGKYSSSWDNISKKIMGVGNQTKKLFNKETFAFILATAGNISEVAQGYHQLKLKMLDLLPIKIELFWLSVKEFALKIKDKAIELAGIVRDGVKIAILKIKNTLNSLANKLSIKSIALKTKEIALQIKETVATKANNMALKIKNALSFGWIKSIGKWISSMTMKISTWWAETTAIKANSVAKKELAATENIPSKGGGTMSALKGVKIGDILKGAAAILIIAAATWVLAKAMQEFNSVTWAAVAIGIVSLLALTAVFVGIGLLMGSGVGATAVLLGAAAMLVIAGSLWVLGKALQGVAKAGSSGGLNNIFDSIVSLIKVLPGLLLLSVAFIGLSYSIGLLSIAMAGLALTGIAALPVLTIVHSMAEGTSGKKSSNSKREDKTDKILNDINNKLGILIGVTAKQKGVNIDGKRAGRLLANSAPTPGIA